MAQFGPYWETQILRHITSSGTMTQQTLWIGLCTAAPLTGSGSNPALCECATNTAGYARALVATANWAAVSGSSPAQVLNSAAFTFSTSTTAWGDISYVALFNTATVNDGNVLCFATAAATKTIATGDQAVIGTNSLALQIT